MTKAIRIPAHGSARGILKTTAIRTYPPADTVAAHRDAEAASYAGPVVLVP